MITTVEGLVNGAVLVKRNANFFLKLDVQTSEGDKVVFLNECCDIPEWRDVKNSYKFTKIFCHRKMKFDTPQDIENLVGQSLKCEASEKPEGFFKVQNVLFSKPKAGKKGKKGSK